MNSISGQIETLRQKLLETVDSYRGDFLHPNVLRISQELDTLIVKLQHGKRRLGGGASGNTDHGKGAGGGESDAHLFAPGKP